MTTEKELLEHVLWGDRSAQRDLYCRYADAAMTTCMRYVADREVARDLLQDSFVKIFTSIGRFEYRGEGSLRRWVMRIVVNESLSCLRQKGKLLFTDGADSSLLDSLPDEEPDVVQVPAEVLHSLIRELPAGYRTVLNLYAFEQKSHKEIGQMLGIAASTSSTQLMHAKRMLARKVKDYIKQHTT